MPTRIYLASQSPRRHHLLQQLGVPHQVLLPEDAESADALEALEDVLPGEAPRRYVRRVTALKLDAAVGRLAQLGQADRPVLCADTTVALGREILGKPHDADDAAAMLLRLSGRSHRVLTAVAMAQGNWRGEALSESRVRFARMTEKDIAAYIGSGEWQGKAGAYAIQGRAAAHVAYISGSYSGIMGLPLHETAGLLNLAGVVF